MPPILSPATPWTLERGARLLAPDTVRFTVWAPAAKEVAVRVRRARESAEHRLEPRDGGVFDGTVMGSGGGTDYAYRLDDGRELPDPVSRHQPHGVHGKSRVVDPLAFHWTDGSWVGLEMADLVLYEVHPGTFSALGSFDGVCAHLSELRDLGVTAVELMPVGEFPGARNWGYDGAHPYAPQSSYGGPEALKRLVDAAHRIGMAVVLDVVYNHLGPEGNYLGAYGPYFSDRYKTPWGDPINFDGPESDEVRRYFVDNALYWISEFHIDGLRLDAVHAIFDFSARHILAEITDAVHRQAERLGRRALVIAESDLNDPRLVRDRDRGGYGMDGQWSDDFHHAVHAQLTGERVGYYADFGGVGGVAKTLRDRFVNDGRYSAHRRRRHGAPAVDVPTDRFVIALQNHDQVGNRAAGDRLSTLVSFEELKLAAALLLLAPYVPLLFMGEEYGETNPFLYFVSHGDAELLRAVREGRRAEFASFGWEAVPDPGAEQTFRRSRLDRAKATDPPHAAIRALYGDLLRLRRSERALRPGHAVVQVTCDEEAEWIALGYRTHLGCDLAALFNWAAAPRRIPLPATPHGKHWSGELSTAQAEYGGDGRSAHVLADGRSGPVAEVAARTAELFRCADDTPADRRVAR